MAFDIGITVLIVMLILWLEHWFPWHMALGKELPRLVAYVLGVLAMVLPLSGLYWMWSLDPPGSAHVYLIALWVVVLAGGAAVGIAYVIDWILRSIRTSNELQELIDAKKITDTVS